MQEQAPARLVAEEIYEAGFASVHRLPAPVAAPAFGRRRDAGQGDGDVRILQDRSRLLAIMKGGKFHKAPADRWVTQRVSA